MLLLALFFWLLVTPFFSIASIVFAFLLARELRNSRKHQHIWLLPLLIPISSFAMYLLVDFFENQGGGYTTLWWFLMAIVAWWPAFIYIRIKKNKSGKA